MFDFLKNKLKQITEKITKKQKTSKLSLKTKIKGKLSDTFSLSQAEIDSFVWDLELSLLEADVASGTAETISHEMRAALTNKTFKRGEDIEETIKQMFRHILRNILSSPNTRDFIKEAERSKPYIIMFVGPNGAGKTTTIAKVSRLLKDRGLSSIFAASDTFRAASIEQLEEHAKRLGVRLIKHTYGADPAAVAFDAVKSAKAHGIDCVLIDTAGRQETNRNLMEELKKIARVVSPHMVIYVDEALAGNVVVDRVKQFDNAVHIDGVILTKIDVDVKGGGTISITKETGKPILYLGTGQDYSDIELFVPDKIISRILD